MHCEMYYLTIRATNVWIKFIPSINDIRKKRIFEVFSSTRKYTESTGVSWEFLICGSKL